MQNEILINAETGETRVAILEKGQFTELHIERASARSVVNSVIKGRVTRVLPGMQAAFVDVGLEKAAFLYAGDYIGPLDPAGVELDEEPGPRGRRRGRNGEGRYPPKIETLLREGQEIVVQVAKEPIGSKGARITSHVSIAGRHLVLTPWSQRVGVSRRIDADRERRRLREVVDRLRPRDLGFIIRTAGEGIREADLEADVRYLTSVWDEIQLRTEQARAPDVLYAEPALPLRVIRDFANAETRRIVVDARGAYEEMQSFVERFVADPKPRLQHYEGGEPIFDHFGIEGQIDASLGRKVWLKSGGYLIIDQSEALTAIDVNTGRYVGKRDLEETVLKTNLEAVKEIVYQLRLRNIGGLIIIDLIDMESAENREKVYRALQETVRHDKARTNILKISELGLVEMTRKRTRENLVQMLCEPCAHCDGRGYVLAGESVAFKVLRQVRKDLPRFCGRHVALSVNRRVAEHLLGPEQPALRALEAELGREIEIRARADLHQEQFELVAVDQGPPVALDVPWLLGSAAGPAADAAAEAAPPEDDAEPETVAGPAEAPEQERPTEPGPPATDETEPEAIASGAQRAEDVGAPESEPSRTDDAAAASEASDPDAPWPAAESRAGDAENPREVEAPELAADPQPVDGEEEYRILPAAKPEES